MPETGSEETGRKRASKKHPAGASRDLAYKPSRKPVLSRSSPYNIRQGEQSVSQLEGEVVVSEVVEGAAHEVPVAEEGTVIVEKEFEEEDRMSGRGSEAGDMVEILRLMSERDAQFREDLAAAAEERRKEEEVRRRVEVELRRADEEARRMELREMFRNIPIIPQYPSSTNTHHPPIHIIHQYTSSTNTHHPSIPIIPQYTSSTNTHNPPIHIIHQYPSSLNTHHPPIPIIHQYPSSINTHHPPIPIIHQYP